MTPACRWQRVRASWVLDDQDEDARARTTRHRPTGETLHAAPPPPHPAPRRRQGRHQRAYRPQDRARSPPAVAETRPKRRRNAPDPLDGIWESDILPLLEN